MLWVEMSTENTDGEKVLASVDLLKRKRKKNQIHRRRRFLRSLQQQTAHHYRVARAKDAEESESARHH